MDLNIFLMEKVVDHSCGRGFCVYPVVHQDVLKFDEKDIIQQYFMLMNGCALIKQMDIEILKSFVKNIQMTL